MNNSHNPHQIPVFLDKVDLKILGYRWDIADLETRVDNQRLIIETYWKANPSLRFGQMLITAGIVSDTPIVWAEPLETTLSLQGLKEEEYIVWGSIGKDKKEHEALFSEWKNSLANYGLSVKDAGVIGEKLKKGAKLQDFDSNTAKLKAAAFSAWFATQPKPTYKPICELSDDHIANIILTQKLSERYKKLFKIVLESRQNPESLV